MIPTPESEAERRSRIVWPLLPPWSTWSRLLKEGRIGDAMVNYLEETGGSVTIRELEYFVSPVICTKGNLTLGLAGNRVLWRRLSTVFAAALKELLREGRVVMCYEPSPWLGCGWVDRLRRGKPGTHLYASPRYVPVVFRLADNHVSQKGRIPMEAVLVTHCENGETNFPKSIVNRYICR